MIKSKKQMYTVIGAFALIMLLGTITYAFFNYTRTGTANNIRTGRIYFNSTQNGTLNLTNLFPVASNEVGNSNQIEVRVYGDTTYAGGEEFEISLVSVNNSITSGSTEKTIPINYIASYERTPVATGETPNNIGTSSNDYFTERGSSTAVYQLNAAGEITEGEQVLVGYIPKDVAVDGTLIIKAYLDRSNIAISDTYPSGDVTHTETSGETSVEVVDYTNGTTSEWVGDRTVLTTDEWNSLQNTPISFKIKAVANEGTWVENPNLAWKVISRVEGLEDVAGAKRYVGANPDNYVIFNNEQWRIIGVYGDKIKIVKATPSKTSQVWNSNYSNNNWSGSSVQQYLYNTYYSSLSSTFKNMIDYNSGWNIGQCAYDISASDAYTCATATTWSGYVGVVATYEYLYAAENDGVCWNQSGYRYNGFGGGAICNVKDWMYNTLTSNGTYASLDINNNYYGGIVNISSGGYIASNSPDYTGAVSPVVYLKSNVMITGGTGESGGNEYTLSYTTS